MTHRWTDEIETEYQRVAPQLGALIKSNGRTTQAEDDVDGNEPTEFHGPMEGLLAFTESAKMQRLKRDEPEKFKAAILDFILGHELVAKGVVSAQQVGVLSHLLNGLPGVAHRGERSAPLNKSVPHAEHMPQPWSFEQSERGYTGYRHSAEMQALQRERPALWRKHALDFYASISPAPSPKEVSQKRQELEAECPDHAPSPMAKALAERNRLSFGQSVLVQNFGASIGDPAQWLRSR